MTGSLTSFAPRADLGREERPTGKRISEWGDAWRTHPSLRGADYADDPMKALVRKYDAAVMRKGERSIFECRPR